METQPQIPLRTLRHIAESLSPTRLTPRQQARQNRILLIATDLIARFGRAALSFNRLAQAMRYAPSTLRWHFADLDSLLLHIMERHINILICTVGLMPADAPDRADRLAAAYRAAIRAPGGSLVGAHRLLQAERHTLPPEDQARLAEAIQKLAAMLPGLDPETLELRDNPPAETAPISDRAAETASPATPSVQQRRLIAVRPPLAAEDRARHAAIAEIAELTHAIAARTADYPTDRRNGLLAGVAHAPTQNPTHAPAA